MAFLDIILLKEIIFKETKKKKAVIKTICGMEGKEATVVRCVYFTEERKCFLEGELQVIDDFVMLSSKAMFSS